MSDWILWKRKIKKRNFVTRNECEQDILRVEARVEEEFLCCVSTICNLIRFFSTDLSLRLRLT